MKEKPARSSIALSLTGSAIVLSLPNAPYLAWIRTGLAFMGFGFVVARFGLFLREIAAAQGGPSPSVASTQWFGIGFVALGVLHTAGALATHIATVRRLNRGEPFVGRPTWLGLSIAVLLVIVGVLMTGYLVLSAPAHVTPARHRTADCLGIRAFCAARDFSG